MDRGPTTFKPGSGGRALVTGVVLGVAWSAALRGWMVELAGPASTFSWLTFWLLLLPGSGVGAALAWAAHMRRDGPIRYRWILVFSPALFLTALADPVLFKALLETGMGGGSIGVVLVALLGGYALSSRHRGWARAGAGSVAVAGTLAAGAATVVNSGLTVPRGVWAALYVCSLLGLLAVAAAIPYGGQPRGRDAHRPLAAIVIGTTAGLAWASALLAVRAAIPGQQSDVDSRQILASVILPGVALGASIGWRGRRGAATREARRRSTVALALVGIAISVAAAPPWTTAGAIAGPDFPAASPRAAWATVLYLTLLATLSLAIFSFGTDPPGRRPIASLGSGQPGGPGPQHRSSSPRAGTPTHRSGNRAG